MGQSAWEGSVGIPTLPIFWNMLTASPDVVGQGTWTRAIGPSVVYNAVFRNITSANGDNFTCNFRCPTGTYKLRFNAGEADDRGIVDVDIDTVEKGSFDLYAAVPNETNIEEITGIVLSAGAHTLKFRVDGKNGSSTDYFFLTQGIWLQRTA